MPPLKGNMSSANFIDLTGDSDDDVEDERGEGGAAMSSKGATSSPIAVKRVQEPSPDAGDDSEYEDRGIDILGNWQPRKKGPNSAGLSTATFRQHGAKRQRVEEPRGSNQLTDKKASTTTRFKHHYYYIDENTSTVTSVKPQPGPFDAPTGALPKVHPSTRTSLLTPPGSFSAPASSQNREIGLDGTQSSANYRSQPRTPQSPIDRPRTLNAISVASAPASAPASLATAKGTETSPADPPSSATENVTRRKLPWKHEISAKDTGGSNLPSARSTSASANVTSRTLPWKDDKSASAVTGDIPRQHTNFSPLPAPHSLPNDLKPVQSLPAANPSLHENIASSQPQDSETIHTHSNGQVAQLQSDISKDARSNQDSQSNVGSRSPRASLEAIRLPEVSPAPDNHLGPVDQTQQRNSNEAVAPLDDAINGIPRIGSPIAPSLVLSPEVVRSADLRPERRKALIIINRLAPMSRTQRTDALVDLVQQKIPSEPQLKNIPWFPEEDALLLHAKEELEMVWADIRNKYLPHRGSSWHTCQTRYSMKLAFRDRSIPQAPEDRGASLSLPHRSIDSTPRKSTRQTITTLRKPERIHESHVSDREDPKDSSGVSRSPEVDIPSSRTSSIPPRSRRSSGLPSGGVFKAGGTVSNASNISRTPSKTLQNTLDARLRTEAALASGTIRISRQRTERPGRVDLQNRSLRQHQRANTPRGSVEIQRPYLSNSERRFLKDSLKHGYWNVDDASTWDGQVLHVDFTREEIEALCPYVLKVLNLSHIVPPLSPLHSSMRHLLGKANDEDLQKIAYRAVNQGGILNRNMDSLYSFLKDMASSEIISKGSYMRIAAHPQTPQPTTSRMATALRARELGNGPSKVPLALRETLEDTLNPYLAFTGTSGDVNAVAWSPNGQIFVAGSAALTDEHSMQYNLPNNLLLGNLANKTLLELPEHATKRRLAAGGGVNSLPSMHASQDPLLFQSVSAAGFSADGQALITTGYDNTARIWDLRDPDPEYPKPVCRWSIMHHGQVDCLAISPRGLFATGSKLVSGNTRSLQSVRVFRHDLEAEDRDYLKVHKFSSSRAKDRLEKKIHPSCMRWGYGIWEQQRYLLCGFTSGLEDYGEGETCVWDVEAGEPVGAAFGTRNVFDVAWSPNIFGRFAVGSSSGVNVNRGTRSVIRIYDSTRSLSNANTLLTNKTRTFELECPARDMNDIVFNPSDENLISVGCTNGSTYVWDLRNPGEILHKFSHGLPAHPLEDNINPELADTGVRFVSWAGSRRLLYTGSSDGVVAQWDPYRAPEDAFRRKIVQLNSGVMSGAFSPDFSNLLLGEVNGSVMTLQVGQEAKKSVRECEAFTLQKADDAALSEVYDLLNIEAPAPADVPDDGGISAGRELLESKSITIKPFGDLPLRQAVQGPNYTGPFDRDSDAPRLRAAAERFQSRFKVSETTARGARAENLITQEERGDSGGWKARIPASFRFEADRTNDKASLRCSRLSCHNAPLKNTGSDLDFVSCVRCGTSWRIDVLGYFRDTTAMTKKHEVMMDEADDINDDALKEAMDEFKMDEDDRSMLQDLEAYLHENWQDPLPSPR